jgi:hypothetical protein
VGFRVHFGAVVLNVRQMLPVLNTFSHLLRIYVVLLVLKPFICDHIAAKHGLEY